MPTTTVETPLRAVAFRRRIAKELSFWWRRHGVDPSHVVTRFVDGSAERTFIGPFPIAAESGTPAFAFVTCVVAQARDAAFRAAYARHIRRVLAPEIAPERVFVAVQPTDPADHFTPARDWGAEQDVS